MAKLGNSPDETTVLRLEQRKSFSTGVLVQRSDGRPVDLTGCELTLDWLHDRAKLRHPEQVTEEDTTRVVAELTDPRHGFAYLSVQASELDLPPASYPFTITLRSADGYTSVLVKGELQVQSNPEFAAAETTFSTGAASTQLEIELRSQTVLRVTVGTLVPPGAGWLSATDQAKLDQLVLSDDGVQVDLSDYARTAYVDEGDEWLVWYIDYADGIEAYHRETGDADTLAAATAHADAEDEATLAAAALAAAAADAALLAFTAPTGTVIAYAGATAPSMEWLVCDGAAHSRIGQARLFARIGTTHGAGDGLTTFNVPDCRDRTVIGASGTYPLGTKGGAATHLLTAAEMPSHTHIQNAHTHIQNAHNHTQDAHSHGLNVQAYINAGPYGAGSGSTHNFNVNGVNTSAATATNQPATATNQNATAVNQNTGGGVAHNNMQPYIAMNFLIKT